MLRHANVMSGAVWHLNFSVVCVRVGSNVCAMDNPGGRWGNVIGSDITCRLARGCKVCVSHSGARSSLVVCVCVCAVVVPRCSPWVFPFCPPSAVFPFCPNVMCSIVTPGAGVACWFEVFVVFARACLAWPLRVRCMLLVFV